MLGCLAAAASGAEAQETAIRQVKVFVPDMAENLDALIREEVFEQAVQVQLVTEEQAADFALTGFAPIERNRKWRTAWLPAGSKTTTRSVSLVRSDGELMWALEVPKKNRLVGPLARDGRRKLAAQIANWLGYLAP